jgi:tetratricopeptide (TPR) repeat protein
MAHPDIRCRGSRDYWLAVVFFALGLLSKTMLVTLPFVLLLLDYWPLQRFNTSPRHPMSGLLVEKIPFFVLSVAACVATAVAQEHLILKVQGLSLSIPWRVGNAIMAYADYLGHMVYPVGLALIYPHPVGRMPVGRIAFSAVLLLIITAGVVAGRRKHRYLLTGWFWYLVMLLPVIDISQEVDSARADRYTYLPQIGLYIMVTWGAVALCGAWRWRRVALGWAATAVLAGLTAGAYVQTGYWKNSATLWAHTVACTSDNAVAEDSLGSALLAQGQRVEAIQHYQRAVALKPDRPVFHFNLAIALARQGHVAEAIQHYEQALQLKPDYPQAHLNLGNALAGQGKLADAIQQYQRALELHADYVDAHYSLGNALLQQGKPAEAIQQYERALELDPNNTQVEVNLGNTLAQQGRLAEAIQHFQRAIQLDPNQPGIHLNLGNALAASGHLPEAIQNFEQELQIAPDFAQAHVSLGTALATQGNLGDALQHFQRALEINPNFAEAHYYSGLALAGLGKGSDAISQFQQAAELATAQGNIRLAQAARQRLQALQPALPQATKEDGR